MARITEDILKAKFILATHPGRIKERLIAAGRTGFTGYELKDIPSELAEDYSNLVAKFVEGPKGPGDGLVEQTISVISEDDAMEIANEVLEFAHELFKHRRVL